MPNLVMEYSASVEEQLNISGLLEDLHRVAVNSELFDVKSVKSRATRYQHWLIGEQADSQDFIHITFELLAGRTAEQKRELSRLLMEVLVEKAGQLYSLTVNVRDMDTDCFQKVTN